MSDQEFEPPIQMVFLMEIDALDSDGATFTWNDGEDRTAKVVLSRDIWESMDRPSRITSHIHENVLSSRGYHSELDFRRLN